MIFGGLIIVANYGASGSGPTPPPGEFFMITEAGDFMIDESGNFMITE